MTVDHLLFILGAYLVGAIPFGVLVARARGVDIMKVGSGNTGATNVWRTLGKGPGLVVFALDVAKGLIPAAFATQHFGRADVGLGMGLVAVLGHSFSPFLKFKGGKGIATGLGALIGSAPMVALCGFATFMVVLLATRYVSLGSMVAAASLLVWGWIFGSKPLVMAGLAVIATFVIVRHRPNIVRLREGTESKFDFKGRGSKPAVEKNDEQSHES